MAHCVWTTGSDSGETGPDVAGQRAQGNPNADQMPWQLWYLLEIEFSIGSRRDPSSSPRSAATEGNALACLSLSFSNVNWSILVL